MFSFALKKFKNPVIKNSIYLYAYQFIDYFLALFFLTIIARTIGAEEFGKIGLAQSFGIFLVLFMEFGFSLMATRKVAQTKNNLQELKIFIGQIVTFKIFLIIPAMLLTVALILAIPTFYNKPIYIILVSIEAIFYGLNPSWYFRGVEKMKKIVTSKIIFRGLALLIIINFVKSPKDAWIVLASFLFNKRFYLFLFVHSNV